MGQKARAEHPAPDRPRRSGWLNDVLAGPAGFLEASGFDHLQLGGDEVEDLETSSPMRRKVPPHSGSDRLDRARYVARRVIGDPGLAATALRGSERASGCSSVSSRPVGVPAAAIATSRSSSVS